MKYLGSERGKSSIGKYEYLYYAVADKVERRILQPDGKTYSVTRYGGLTEEEQATIGNKLADLSKAPRSRPTNGPDERTRIADEIHMLLGHRASVNAYIKADEIDSPSRKVLVKQGPWEYEWQSFFSLGEEMEKQR